MRNIRSVILFLTIGFSTTAQKQIDNQFNTWVTFSGNHTISKKWEFHSLYSYRRNDLVEHWQQSLLHIGAGYKLTSKIKTQVGYDWIRTFPYGTQPIAQVTDEHRIWVHLNTKFQENRFHFSQRLRFENRAINLFNANMSKNGFVWKYRLRYKLAVNVPINHNRLIDNTLFVSLSDEIFMNFFNQNKYFDQNWFYAGFGWRFNKSISVKVGYMNQFLPKTDGVHVENNDTLSIQYIHNLNFIKN